MTNRIWILIAVSAFVPGVASADTIFSSGSDSLGGGHNGFTAQNAYVAQDFQLGVDSTLTGLVFNAYTNAETQPITDVHVKIYQNVGGVVGGEVFSGSYDVASETATGTYAGYTQKDYAVGLSPVGLAAGEYWLALQVDPSQWDLHWSIPTTGAYIGPGGSGGKIGYGTSYSHYLHEHVFRLEGYTGLAAPVPLPAAAWGGMALFGAARREAAAPPQECGRVSRANADHALRVHAMYAKRLHASALWTGFCSGGGDTSEGDLCEMS